MKILVIDDKQENLDSAKALLSDQEVTTIDNYDDARKLISKNATVDRKEWKVTYKRPDFDVALIDLFLPSSANHLMGEGLMFTGEQMPVGIFLALLAAQNMFPYVAVFTNHNHHRHPASACIDDLNPLDQMEPSILNMNSSKLMMANSAEWLDQRDPNDLSRTIDIQEKINREDLVEVKNWQIALDYLLEH